MEDEKQVGAHSSKPLAEIPLSSLHLSSRLTKSLLRAGASSAEDLLQLSPSDISMLRGSGEKSMDELVSAAQLLSLSILDSGEIDFSKYLETRGVEILDCGLSPAPGEAEVLSSLGEIASYVLSQLDDERLRIIVQRRFALAGSPNLTLEDLGIAFDVTRERIRQLEIHAIDILRDCLIEEDYANKDFHVNPAILNRIKNVSHSISVICFQGAYEGSIIKALDSRFGTSLAPHKSSVALLLTLLGYTRITFPENDLLSIWGFWDSDDRRKLVNATNAVNRLLTRDTPQPLSEIDILIRINRETKKADRLDLRSLKIVLSLCSSVEEYSAGFYWGAFRFLATRGDQVERILTENAEPMHFNDIARELSHRIASFEEGPINPRTLSNQLSNDERFTPIGKSGEWGLADWSLETASIVELMERSLVSRNEPQTSEQIYEFVSERRPARRSSIDAYLNFDERFERLANDRWALALWEETEDAQYWDPVRVGDFVANLFSHGNRRRLPYRDIKEALIREAGVKPRQAMGMLNTNPVITTEKDPETSELIAVVHSDYREKIAEGHSRFVRAQPTLRQQAYDAVRESLLSSSTGRVSLSTLVMRLERDLGGSKRTYYSYISGMEFVEKLDVAGSTEKIVQLKRPYESENTFGLELIGSDDVRRNVERALTFLNEADVDIALLLLAKEFEAILRRYIETAKMKGAITSIPPGHLSLEVMISIVKKEAVISDQAILHFLRQKRNDRAHGEMPSLLERRLMMRQAPTTSSLYIDYILFFDDLQSQLA